MLRFILPSRSRDAAIRFNLGMALSDLGKLDEAEDHLREAIDIDPEMVHARVALGVALMRKKKLQEASEVLEEAVEQDPNDPYALMNLGGCLEALKRDLPRAEACLRKATEILPEAQQMWIGLARV
ncbi:MAG: tetratricopeptide repeat protein [Verrucomicrobiia bacterium]